jgi:LmbE family N-acetylglucosaminyl deacetylase
MSLLVFGAHPDDIEFGCGGVVALEAMSGRKVQLVVCSRGESGSFTTAAQRQIEAEAAAKILGAALQWLELDGDAQLEMRNEHATSIARIIRQHQPGIVLAPSLVQNQHPDHWRLGVLVRDAVRLARYGGLDVLKDLPPHVVEHLMFYALTNESEPNGNAPVLIDVSAPEVMDRWKLAMEAHESQVRSRRYIKLQMSRARVRGLSCGVDYAIPLFPNDPMVLDSLSKLGRGARSF